VHSHDILQRQRHDALRHRLRVGQLAEDGKTQALTIRERGDRVQQRIDPPVGGEIAEHHELEGAVPRARRERWAGIVRKIELQHRTARERRDFPECQAGVHDRTTGILQRELGQRD
jgi:hypothetical protein